MSILKTRHETHPVTVHINVDSGHHYGSLFCERCKTQIQWLSQADAELLIKLDIPVKKIYNRTVKSKFRVK
jgi:hypothetical protein